MGAPAPPRGRKKFSRNLQGKFVRASPAHQVHPQAEQESILGHFCWAGRFGGGSGSFIVVFTQFFEGDYQKGRQLF